MFSVFSVFQYRSDSAWVFRFQIQIGVRLDIYLYHCFSCSKLKLEKWFLAVLRKLLPSDKPGSNSRRTFR